MGWGFSDLLCCFLISPQTVWTTTPAHLATIGNSYATINRKLAAVSRMLSVAVERGNLQTGPTIQRKREGEGRIRFLNERAELQALQLFNQWGKTDHLEALIVLVDTGMRGGELWRLEGRDCDTVQGLLRIWQTKNGRPRSVPMTERVKVIMERRKAKYLTGLLFPGSSNFWFEHVRNRMREVIGLGEDRQFVPYAHRHTGCSRLVQRGVNLRVVQEWMGHKTITVTIRYAHLCPEKLLNAVQVLNPQQGKHYRKSPH